MRFCVDHSVHGGLARALAELGADLRYARELGAETPDSEILDFATADDRVLIAQDTDFGALVFNDHRACVGVISIRFNIRSTDHARETAHRIIALPNGGRDVFTTLDIAGERSRSIAR
jgi:predicted nuclease of predicted toxin-antitoxin system